MKNLRSIALLAMLCLGFVSMNAQDWTVNGDTIFTTKKVRIGTTSSSAELTVLGDSHLKGTTSIQYLSPGFKSEQNGYKFLRFGNPDNYTAGFMHNISNPSFGDGDDFTIFTYSNRDIVLRTGNSANTVIPNGNVGIGTLNPTAKLTVTGNTIISGDADLGGTTKVKYLYPNIGNDSRYRYVRFGKPDKYYAGFMYNNSDRNFGDGNDFTIFTYSNRDIVLKPSGTGAINLISNVSVGGTTIPNGYSFAVAGKGIMEELKVQLRGQWPDYVFEEDYEKLSLEQVEVHIQENGHLHNTPSAAEIKANGGIEISKITVNQQEKIEELYLHMIEMNRTVKTLQGQNKQLQKELADLKTERK